MKPPPTPSNPERNPVRKNMANIIQNDTEEMPDVGNDIIGGILNEWSLLAIPEELWAGCLEVPSLTVVLGRVVDM